jgi:hypothetical protein
MWNFKWQLLVFIRVLDQSWWLKRLEEILKNSWSIKRRNLEGRVELIRLIFQKSEFLKRTRAYNNNKYFRSGKLC